MVTLYRVGVVKVREGAPIVAVDGGMSDNIRPMLYGARYRVAFASPPRDDGPVRVRIVGRHCESGDVLAPDAELPGVPRPGDLLAFAATGAYTYSMASAYNRVGRPAVVGVVDGRARLWLRREDAADLDRLEVAWDPGRRVAPPPGVEVRPARPADAEGFLGVYREAVAEERYLRSERVLRTVREARRLLRHPVTDERACFVAVEGGRVVGWIQVVREPHPVVRHLATFGMAVARDRRRRGVGSALLSEALRWARDRGVSKVELSVYPDNRAALALYRRFGFVEEGRLSGHSREPSGYRDEILMGVWLQGER
ncbi:MAG: hypothetical protein KatS3mg014_0269 [Actinomycetota bacterium]|nr:MAG: hypothetical protein KatS3mg014_0269 [Actinomycetota bacterium]